MCQCCHVVDRSPLVDSESPKVISKTPFPSAESPIVIDSKQKKKRFYPLTSPINRMLESVENPYFSTVSNALDIVEVIGSSPTNPTTKKTLDL